jgi:Rps23 Pro-64 3,4-dihydroxylase Tpa1-like proline 4-hydroxylase
MQEDSIAVNGHSAADDSKKRAKTTSLLDEILFADVLDRETEVRESYRDNKPYPHAQIQNLFQPKFLTSVKDEIKSQTKVNFKESDLFRVYQSIDMANLTPDSELAGQLPHVMKLRELLYSQEWRSFIERIAGLPPSTLNNQIDCACNCHAPGCHLLCHDDVIGTRKISYIIYLTEPDWKEDEGGSLEFYNSQEENGKGTSSPLPAARAWPTFNSMAFFVVKPGQSYHAVQEVIGDRPRLSLQGWFHAADPPKNIELATLQQLKKFRSGDEADGNQKLPVVFDGDDSTTAEFQESDKEYLSKYLKPEYIDDEALDDIQKKFVNDSSVQLRNFLQDKWVPKMEPKKRSVYDNEYYKSGISAEWKLQGPAHKQRFLEYQPESESTDSCQMIGSLMHHVKTQVFESQQFARYLRRLTSLDQPTGVRKGQIRRFRPGLDYTVAHYGLLVDQSVLDATMCFVYDENDENMVWESGDCGGFECYIEADDEDEETGAADEYNEDDDTELLSVSASNNTLSLVFRDPGTMRFVKYVGSTAPSSRYDISMEYEVPPQPEVGDEEDGSGEEEGKN